MAALSISAPAVDGILERQAALEPLDLRDDVRREHARRNIAGVVRRDRDLGMASRAGSAAAAAPAGRRRAWRRRACRRRARRRCRRRPASWPRAALIRNAPPAAPSRLSLRSSARLRSPSVSRRARQQADQDFGARAGRRRARPRRGRSRRRRCVFGVRLQPATRKPSRPSARAASRPITPSPMTPTATSLAAGWSCTRQSRSRCCAS